MRIFYTLLLFIFTHITLNAQIVQYPIANNPVLKKHAQKEATDRKERIQKYREQFNYVDRSGLKTSGVTIFEDAFCVFAGDSLNIVIDTADISGFQSLNILNCMIPTGGSASIGFDPLSLNYMANSNATFALDTICFELCDNENICDTLIYPIIVSRTPDTTISPLTTIPAESETTICVDTTNLPGNFFSSFIESNDISLGITADLGSCILYEAQRFAGIDTVYYEICDQYCVCDIYKVPVQITQDTLSLPFFDDFSKGGNYPSNKTWLDRNVYINNTLANNPPSIGVATFDGLDSNGSPYGGGNGISDILTSAYLNMANTATSTLSFYIQPKGLGLPNSPGDSLVLEFKTAAGDWEIIDSYKAFDGFFVPADSIPADFGEVKSVTISSEYRYNGFQFRFLAYNNRNGGVEGIWSLDYVRLDTNNSPASQKDLALTQAPNDILRNYSSMPWWHFEGNEDEELYDFVSASARNHFDETKNIVDSRVNLNEVTTGINFSNFTVFDATNFLAGETKMIDRNIPDVSRANYLSTLQSSFTGQDNLLFNTSYFIEVTDQETNPLLSDVLTNDTVHQQTIFSNYFAYDDGSAEQGLGVRPVGAQAAVRYHANQADTIRGVQIHFPHVSNDVSNQLFNIKIWVGSLDSDPVYEAVLLKPLYIDDFFQDSLNAFTTYRLNNEAGDAPMPVPIPAGDFFVGWQQASTTTRPIPVGLDKNTPEAHLNNFVKTGALGEWENLPLGFEGALMIRPVVGSATPNSTEVAVNTEEPILSELMNIFPNPATQLLNINLKQGNPNDYLFTLSNSIGQVVYQSSFKDQIMLDNYQNGLYFLKITNLNLRKDFTHKFIIIK